MSTIGWLLLNLCVLMVALAGLGTYAVRRLFARVHALHEALTAYATADDVAILRDQIHRLPTREEQAANVAADRASLAGHLDLVHQRLDRLHLHPPMHSSGPVK